MKTMRQQDMQKLSAIDSSGNDAGANDGELSIEDLERVVGGLGRPFSPDHPVSPLPVSPLPISIHQPALPVEQWIAS
jgi:hypothetical protein